MIELKPPVWVKKGYASFETYKESKRNDYLRNKDKYLARAKERYKSNKDEILVKVKKYQIENKEKLKPFKDKIRDNRRNIISNSSILKGDEWNDFVIQEMNELRSIRNNETGFKWEIDHIIPLVNKAVTGLHVWYNLQLIPRSINKAKHNHLLMGV